jgi:hypothetical protein
MSPSDPARDLLDLGAATLGESGAQPMRARVRPVWAGARLAATRAGNLPSAIPNRGERAAGAQSRIAEAIASCEP